ncbi:SRPBCC family protein [Nocardioides maradonensis]
MTSDRELRAEITIDAPAAAVWAVITDTKALAEISPELMAMTPLRRGGFRVGQQYVGWNRRKGVIWPTRNVVTAVQPEKLLAWDTKSSGARWIYELTAEGSGTRVVQRRPVPHRLTLLSRLFAPLALGGSENHADELEAGMAEGLARIKARVEA